MTRDLVVLGALGMSPQRKEVFRNNLMLIKLWINEFDQEMLQTQTTGQPMTPRGRDKES